MQADPPAQPEADRGDLVLATWALVRACDPDADPVAARLAADTEGGEGFDDPGLEGGHEGAHIARATRHVQHDVDHPLPWAVVGELPAAPAVVHRKPARRQDV